MHCYTLRSSYRYVEVGPGQVCCPDPVYDRVAIGVGDLCCEGVPYSSSGSQICCGGQNKDLSCGATLTAS